MLREKTIIRLLRAGGVVAVRCDVGLCEGDNKGSIIGLSNLSYPYGINMNWKNLNVEDSELSDLKNVLKA